MQILYKEVAEMFKTGRNRMKIELQTIEAANKLIGNTILKEANIKAFIPASKVCRYGIIKGVHQDIADENIARYIEVISRENIQVQEITRLNRRVLINNQPTYSPSQTIKLKFSETARIGILVPSTPSGYTLYSKSKNLL